MKRLSTRPTIHESARVVACELGAYTEVGARTSLLETPYRRLFLHRERRLGGVRGYWEILLHRRQGAHQSRQPPGLAGEPGPFHLPRGRLLAGRGDEAEFFAWRRSSSVSIEHDVWIGHGVVILPGRSIGTGAVVGAGAIVTKDVAPYMIVVDQMKRKSSTPRSVNWKLTGVTVVPASIVMTTSEPI